MKILKVVAPALAILFAVVSALAANSFTKNVFVKQAVSVRDPVCVQNGYCDNTTVTTPCHYHNDGTTLLDAFIPTAPPICQSVSLTGVWTAN